MSVHICAHQFSDNTRCQGVAVRGSTYCRWHRLEAERRRRAARVETLPRIRPIRLHISSHPNLVQRNLQVVIDGLVRGTIPPRQAGLLLYGIATSMRS